MQMKYLKIFLKKNNTCKDPDLRVLSALQEDNLQENKSLNLESDGCKLEPAGTSCQPFTVCFCVKSVEYPPPLKYGFD